VEVLFCDVQMDVNIAVNIDVVEVEEECVDFCTLEEEDEEHEVHSHRVVLTRIFEMAS
jgi:hypothetical protein